MSGPEEERERARIAARLRERFPAEPVPPYPPDFGLDPLGERDEYAAFAGRRWTEIAPEHLSTRGYDISPAVGFSLQSPPHLWNYHVPAFALGALLHEGGGESGHEIADGFLWRLRECPPALGPVDPALPWWHGGGHFANYGLEQCDCLVAFLELVRAAGGDAPPFYEWEPADELVLEAFRARRALLGPP